MAVDTKKFEVTVPDQVLKDVVETDTITDTGLQGVAVYMNQVDNVRQVEIISSWNKCINFLKDNPENLVLASTGCAYKTLDSAEITFTTDVTDIPANGVGAAVDGSLILSTAFGNLIFDSGLGYCRDYAKEFYLRGV